MPRGALRSSKSPSMRHETAHRRGLVAGVGVGARQSLRVQPAEATPDPRGAVVIVRLVRNFGRTLSSQWSPGMSTAHESPDPDIPRRGIVETVVLTGCFAFIALGACGFLLVVRVALELWQDSVKKSYEGVVMSHLPVNDLPPGDPLEALIDSWPDSYGRAIPSLPAGRRPTWLPEGATDVDCAPDGLECIYRTSMDEWTYADADPQSSINLTALRTQSPSAVALAGRPGHWTVIAERHDPWPESILGTMRRLLVRRAEPISLAEDALLEVNPLPGATLRYLSQGQDMAVSPDRTLVAFRRSRYGDGFGFLSSVHVWSVTTDRIDDLLTTGSCGGSGGFGYNWSPDSRYLLLQGCLSWDNEAHPPAESIAMDLHGPVLFDTATGHLYQRSRRPAPTATPTVKRYSPASRKTLRLTSSDSHMPVSTSNESPGATASMMPCDFGWRSGRSAAKYC